MPTRKPHTIKSMGNESLPQLEDNLATLYRSRLESKYFRDSSSSAITAVIYHVQELGELLFSGTGSPTVTKVVSFQETYDKILGYDAHARSSLVSAHVVDVTNTAISIEVRSISGTGNLSAVTSASIPVCYRVIGSVP